MVGVYEQADHERQSAIANYPLLFAIGKSRRSFWLLDLQTGEGAEFYPPDEPAESYTAKFDIQKHRIWVCPLYEPFLAWLYAHASQVFDFTLPAHVDLPDAEFQLSGYRRPGLDGAELDHEQVFNACMYAISQLNMANLKEIDSAPCSAIAHRDAAYQKLREALAAS